MSITVTGRRMNVSDTLRDYAEEKITHSMKVMDIDPLDAEVILYREKNPSNPRPAVCEVTLRTKGHIIRVEEHEEDLHTAIDVAAAKVVRQMRKFKTKVIDKKLDRNPLPEQAKVSSGELDFDKIMDDLVEEEVVRVKEIEYDRLTQEEALIRMDLLGHDFYAYTDWITGGVNILYRRTAGGYGVLKQKK